MVRVHLGAGFGDRARWGLGPLPRLTNLTTLARSPAFARVSRLAPLLEDVSAPTVFERAEGRWEEALVLVRSGGPCAVGDLTAAFDKHIWPSRNQPSTRSKNWRAWSSVVTWAIARDVVDQLLPMDVATLKALMWDFMCAGSSHSMLSALMAAVQSRHRYYGTPPPILGRGEYRAWSRCLACVMGRPLSLKLPIHKSVVAFLLGWRPASLADNRDRLLTSLATIACLRISEVAALQVCDLWFDFFLQYGIRGYDGTAAVHVMRRKNDVERRGHHPALGRAIDPQLDIVFQLRQWLRFAGLAVHPACSKRRLPAARCPSCPPLFPRLRNGPGNVSVATAITCSPQMASKAVKRMAFIAGAAPERFSGVSARKGGLSTAIEAGVEEIILYLQSGHGPPRAARAYMHIRDPRRLLEVFEAFGL